jgi:hypothetical protein
MDAYDRKWIDRVLARCKPGPNGCILWTGFTHWNGYGSTCYRNKSGAVHRRMYQVARGVVLRRDQYVCHHCDVRNCVNVDHLWVGTHQENHADMQRKGRASYQDTHYTRCKHGHDFTPDNTYRDKRGFRQCRACQRRRLRIKAGWPAGLANSAPPRTRLEATLTAST